MVIDKIENLRECLNKMVAEYNFDFDRKEILKVSRELDLLILRYIEESSSKEHKS